MKRGVLFKISTETCPKCYVVLCTTFHLARVHNETCHTVKILIVHVSIITRGVLQNFPSDRCLYIEAWLTVQFFKLTGVDIEAWDYAQRFLDPIIGLLSSFCRAYASKGVVTGYCRPQAPDKYLSCTVFQ